MITKTGKLFKSAKLLPEVQLRPHQTAAVDDLVRKDGNLILSHPVGSGKTVTGIAGFERLRELGKAAKALVVAPASLRENFAEKGVRKFTDDDYVIFGNKQEAAAGVDRIVDPDNVTPEMTPAYAIMSYDMFRKDPEKYLKAHGADTVIFDEVHRIKNDASATFSALKSNRSRFKNFIGMTGSVVSNTPADVVPLIDAMTEGKHRLGNKTSFENRFVSRDPDGRRDLKNPMMVRSLISPYVNHVTKEQIESSDSRPPRKNVQYVDVPMSPEQAAMYRLAIDKLDPVTKAKLMLGKGKLSDKELKGIFNKLMKSRQVANSLTGMYTDMTLSEAAQKTPKVKRLLDDVERHINKTPDAQVVIHSNLLESGLDVIEAGLTDRGIEYGKFVGKGNKGVTEASRQQDVLDFNAGRRKALLISSAGGEGLDLPNTTMFAALDGHFNPERVNQAEARGIRAGGLAHRAEKDREVIVNRYRSILPRSKVETGRNLWAALKPGTYVDRILDGQPLWQSPFRRTKSVDEMIYELAANKDFANEKLRAQFNKTGETKNKYLSPGFKSEKPIIDAYFKKYQDQLLSGDHEGAWIDRGAEQAYVDDLRQFYTTMGQPKHKINRIGKAQLKDYSGLTTRGDILKKHLKNDAVAAATTFPFLSIPYVLDSIRDFKYLRGRGHKLPTALRAGAYKFAVPATLAAGLGIGSAVASVMSSRNPYTIATKAQSNRRSKLRDEDLLRLLRGEVVTTEKVQRTDDFLET